MKRGAAEDEFTEKKVVQIARLFFNGRNRSAAKSSRDGGNLCCCCFSLLLLYCYFFDFGGRILTGHNVMNKDCRYFVRSNFRYDTIRRSGRCFFFG
jgi:hypothetical protein